MQHLTCSMTTCSITTCSAQRAARSRQVVRAYPVHTTIVPADVTLASSHWSSLAFDSVQIGIGDESAFAGGLTINTCTRRCMLHVACNMLHVACCILHVACCILHAACCKLVGGGMTKPCAL